MSGPFGDECTIVLDREPELCICQSDFDELGCTLVDDFDIFRDRDFPGEEQRRVSPLQL